MEGILILGALAFVGYALYKCGKREGSRKGFNVGVWRCRRRHR